MSSETALASGGPQGWGPARPTWAMGNIGAGASTSQQQQQQQQASSPSSSSSLSSSVSTSGSSSSSPFLSLPVIVAGAAAAVAAVSVAGQLRRLAHSRRGNHGPLAVAEGGGSIATGSLFAPLKSPPAAAARRRTTTTTTSAATSPREGITAIAPATATGAVCIAVTEANARALGGELYPKSSPHSLPYDLRRLEEEGLPAGAHGWRRVHGLLSVSAATRANSSSGSNANANGDNRSNSSGSGAGGFGGSTAALVRKYLSNEAFHYRPDSATLTAAAAAVAVAVAAKCCNCHVTPTASPSVTTTATTTTTASTPSVCAAAESRAVSSSTATSAATTVVSAAASTPAAAARVPMLVLPNRVTITSEPTTCAGLTLAESSDIVISRPVDSPSKTDTTNTGIPSPHQRSQSLSHRHSDVTTGHSTTSVRSDTVPRRSSAASNASSCGSGGGGSSGMPPPTPFAVAAASLPAALGSKDLQRQIAYLVSATVTVRGDASEWRQGTPLIGALARAPAPKRIDSLAALDDIPSPSATTTTTTTTAALAAVVVGISKKDSDNNTVKGATTTGSTPSSLLSSFAAALSSTGSERGPTACNEPAAATVAASVPPCMQRRLRAAAVSATSRLSETTTTTTEEEEAVPCSPVSSQRRVTIAQHLTALERRRERQWSLTRALMDTDTDNASRNTAAAVAATDTADSVSSLEDRGDTSCGGGGEDSGGRGGHREESVAAQRRNVASDVTARAAVGPACPDSTVYAHRQQHHHHRQQARQQLRSSSVGSPSSRVPGGFGPATAAATVSRHGRHAGGESGERPHMLSRGCLALAATGAIERPSSSSSTPCPPPPAQKQQRPPISDDRRVDDHRVMRRSSAVAAAATASRNNTNNGSESTIGCGSNLSINTSDGDGDGDGDAPYTLSLTYHDTATGAARTIDAGALPRLDLTPRSRPLMSRPASLGREGTALSSSSSSSSALLLSTTMTTSPSPAPVSVPSPLARSPVAAPPLLSPPHAPSLTQQQQHGRDLPAATTIPSATTATSKCNTSTSSSSSSGSIVDNGSAQAAGGPFGAPLPPTEPTRGPRLQGVAGRRGEMVIGAFLGGGACGKVYECLNTETGRVLAAKQIVFDQKDPRLRQRLKQLELELEVLTLAAKGDAGAEGIVGFHGAEKRGQSVVMYLEYCQHGSLLDYMARANNSSNNSVSSPDGGDALAELWLASACPLPASHHAPRHHHNHDRSNSNEDDDADSTTTATPPPAAAAAVNIPGTTASLTEATRPQMPPLSLAELRRFTLQVTQAVHYLHSRSYAHLDVKTANVLVTGDGNSRLADLGCAMRLGMMTAVAAVQGEAASAHAANGGGDNDDSNNRDEQEEDGHHDHDHHDHQQQPPSFPVLRDHDAITELRGTALYMPPEMIRFERDRIGGPADVWSLGCVVMEMASGCAPWRHVARDKLRVLFKVGSARAELPLPPLLRAWAAAARARLAAADAPFVASRKTPRSHDEVNNGMEEEEDDDDEEAAATTAPAPSAGMSAEDRRSLALYAALEDFTARCLMVRPDERSTTEELLSHPFLTL